MREFDFELRLCARLEDQGRGIVARQLGGSVADPGGRVVDCVVVSPGREFARRAAITGETIPDAAIDSAVGTARARYWKEAFDCHPEHARRATERACEAGFFERERRGGRDYVRRTTAYPEEWFGELVGIENKPDLDRPGDLASQLRTDVALGLFDRVILATASHVTRPRLNRLPEAVGVWRLADGELTVVREATPLDPSAPGIEPLAEHPGRTDIAVVSPEAKARKRRRIAERAYGKGWRVGAFPACGACDPEGGETAATTPHCRWKGRLVDPASECGPDCPGHEPIEAPADPDLAAEREARTPWIADPAGPRRQSGLDRFG